MMCPKVIALKNRSFPQRDQEGSLLASMQPRAAEKASLGQHPRACLPFQHASCTVSPRGSGRSLLFTIPHTSALSHAFIHLLNRHSPSILESPLGTKHPAGF